MIVSLFTTTGTYSKGSHVDVHVHLIAGGGGGGSGGTHTTGTVRTGGGGGGGGAYNTLAIPAAALGSSETVTVVRIGDSASTSRWRTGRAARRMISARPAPEIHMPVGSGGQAF